MTSKDTSEGRDTIPDYHQQICGKSGTKLALDQPIQYTEVFSSTGRPVATNWIHVQLQETSSSTSATLLIDAGQLFLPRIGPTGILTLEVNIPNLTSKIGASRSWRSDSLMKVEFREESGGVHDRRPWLDHGWMDWSFDKTQWWITVSLSSILYMLRK